MRFRLHISNLALAILPFRFLQSIFISLPLSLNHRQLTTKTINRDVYNQNSSTVHNFCSLTTLSTHAKAFPFNPTPPLCTTLTPTLQHTHPTHPTTLPLTRTLTLPHHSISHSTPTPTHPCNSHPTAPQPHPNSSPSLTLHYLSLLKLFRELIYTPARHHSI